MTKVLDDNSVKQIKELFADLKEPVQILFFGSKKDCDYCEPTHQLLEELAAISDKIGFSVHDIEEDADLASAYNLDKAPATIIAAKNGDEVTDQGIQFSGIPSGHELNTLINDVILVSNRDSGLDQETRDFLKGLDKPVLLQVFVTPTCPYCPRAVFLAHQMAMENPEMVRAEGVESMEFPELAQKFMVSGVPQTVINSGASMVVGAVPEGHLLSEIRQAVAN